MAFTAPICVTVVVEFFPKKGNENDQRVSKHRSVQIFTQICHP